MKLLSTTLAVCAVLLSQSLISSFAAEVANEQQLITTLQSSGSLQEKDAVCAKLKRIGTAQCIPALASLLSDEQLSHSARYALESMPFPEAGRALIEALPKTSGLTKAGIINSLANRRESAAVPALTQCLAAQDATIATAAASALGKIGGTQAVPALMGTLAKASPEMLAAVEDALLRIANKMLAAGDRMQASMIFHRLIHEKDAIQTAAYVGLIRASGDQSLSLVLSGIQGHDGPLQIAALQMAREIKDSKATRELVALLPRLSPVVQLALIEALDQRGDAAAAPAILPFVTNADLSVRVAAITALGTLGNASSTAPLAEASVAANEAEQKAARQSLLQLRGAGVTDQLLALLTSAKPEVQVEVVRALAGRAETTTVPRLLELAQAGNDSARKAAYRALGQLAGKEHIASLVLLLEAKNEAARFEAQEALASVCQRVQDKEGRLDVAPIEHVLSNGSVEARIALLPVASMIPDEHVRAALRRTRTDANAELRSAAIRAICNSRDPELLPDVLSIAREASELNIRVVAIQGYVRLATEEENTHLSTTQRAESLKQILALAQRPEEKQLVLGGLANVPTAATLELVVPLLDDAAVRAEAAQAAIKIASDIFGAYPELVTSALKKVILATNDATRRQAAEAILKAIDATKDFMTAWQAAGPYRENGKDFSALFDAVFPPETPEANKVQWKPLPAGTDAKRPWVMDLFKAFGGEQCVAYARTYMYSENEQPGRLELGSDDGIKVWINGKLVHANNAARPISVGSDKVNVTLKPGWNTLLLKVTQNNQGWEYCARLVKPDGSLFEKLRVDPNAPKSL